MIIQIAFTSSPWAIASRTTAINPNNATAIQPHNAILFLKLFKIKEDFTDEFSLT
jgi:hypothetical protein